jgi:apolipoprotein N-acyltransferase
MSEPTPSRSAPNYPLVAGGGLAVLIGLVWFGQGLGWIGGSVMTGVTFWAVVGPVVTVVGALLVRRGLRRSRADG